MRTWRSQSVWNGGLSVLWFAIGIAQLRSGGPTDFWFGWWAISLAIVAALGAIVHLRRANRYQRQLESIAHES
jgi:uncharacterized membrane protein